MIVENAQEKDLHPGGQIVESAKTSFIYWFVNGCQVRSTGLIASLILVPSDSAQLVAHGNLRAQYDVNGKIDLLDLVTTGHAEYIPRSQLQPPESPDQKQSPKVGKGLNKRAQQRQPVLPQITLPDSMVNDDGVTVAVMRFLEVRAPPSVSLHDTYAVAAIIGC
jgi:hypothetical protein